MMAKDKRVDEDRCCKEEIVTANPCKLVERNPQQRQFGFDHDTIATRDLAAGHHARQPIRPRVATTRHAASLPLISSSRQTTPISSYGKAMRPGLWQCVKFIGVSPLNLAARTKDLVIREGRYG